MKVAIIGFGKFGQLLAKLLSEEKEVSEILVFSDDLKKSAKRNFKKVEFVSLEEACLSEAVILAVPISAISDVLEKINPLLKQGTLLIDVCSVKVFPCMQMKKKIKEGIDLLGTHPLWGPDSVKANQGIKDLKIVLSPVRVSDQKVRLIKKSLEKAGLEVMVKSPAEHDEAMAHSQALAQFVGKTLELMPFQDNDLATLGCKQLSGLLPFVQNNSNQLFNDLQTFNPFAVQVRKRFMEIALHLTNDLNSQEKKIAVRK